ncbi:BON domain-containing protein [Methyloversatilis sp.]|uniref:BON domain-containing protein n=1 Tax=Methyloversatilis sp. TaxID=2569862 RepID=UPI002736C080|nr:BON domain-containing protein [Methyloversatilis sp.]MDP2870781.1 BON domain-containing protein [Methyloversatilis sp.]MDP3287995.1 BON domain-containing protein [Methyloversatilis sp.]MDP3456242.1 BON domain-containing protein [Methyloversatilis sp.]MDP3579375.1 BON domain-containing protein [Methyloversatilis sp.]
MTTHQRSLPTAAALACLGVLLLAGCDKQEPLPVTQSPSTAPAAMPSSATTQSMPGSEANLDDAGVTTRVTTALLADPTIKAFPIEVISLKGDVRLLGVVDTQVQRERVLEVARGVEGVHALHDELTLRQQ